MNRPSRREYLALVLAVPIRAGTRRLGREPLISAQDFAQYPAIVTPTEDFYVRNHFEVPSLDATRYALRVGGLVERETSWSLPKLFAPPQVSLTAVVECAGNGVGVGAVGCTKWQGVRLRELLQASGLKQSARFVRFTGADRGREPDALDEISYSRTLPLDDALADTVMVSMGMNDRVLSPEHGAPARLLAAGRYGMDSVKWLTQIEVLDSPDDSLFMARRFRRVVDGTVADPVTSIRVKSVIVSPAANTAIRGRVLVAGGYAWAGSDAIERVDVRLDRGLWVRARLLGSPRPLEWSAWQIEFDRLRPGSHTLESRATSEAQQNQPLQRNAARSDAYELNQVHLVGFTSGL